MLKIEDSGKHFLLSRNATYMLAEKILVVIKWLCLPNHKNLLTWLIIFLFREDSTDTKRPYLFLHGPPNAGKTFFMNILAPPASANTQDAKNIFLIKNRSFAHFGADKSGDYDLHMLIFDDPGEVKGKQNQLDPSIILNLANNNLTHSLPVKYGFMNLKRGQIAIVSNREASGMFSAENLEAMKTRLLNVQFTPQDPFPLKVKAMLLILLFMMSNMRMTFLT
jgi:ATPase involved in DNA replication initiation